MDKSVQYAQVMSNFDSVYNAGPNLVQHHTPVIYMPISSFSSDRNRSTSPSLSSSSPKFNLNLYKPNEYLSDSIDYPSPSSSVIVHHHPVYSPAPPPPSQAISKLRQLNDELCHTLAQSELIYYSQPSPSHRYIHHHPIPHETYRSRPPKKRDSSSSSSSTESDQPETKKHNARITYKVRIPRRQNSLSKLDQLLISTSDAYSQDDPMTLDIYPTRDQGFIKKIRNRPDNQSPWLADSPPIRRNSYSEDSTYRTPRTPRAPDYDNQPIQPKSRLASCKERPRSSSVKSRFRPDTAPNRLRQSASTFSTSAPVWRPNGSIKNPKFMGSHAPPSKPKPPPSEATWNPAGSTNKTKAFRAFDPGSKSLPTKAPEPVWQPPSKRVTKKPHRYFEPTLKPELTAPLRKETEPVLQKKAIKNQPRLSSGDPMLKTRIANAESKVKSAWGPTTTVKEPKPPIPRSFKPTTIPPKPNVKPFQPIKKVVPAPPISTDTGRSSLNDVPTKPLFQSTPRNQSIVKEDGDDADDLFEEESQIAEDPEKPVIPHPPPQIEKTPSKLPNTLVPAADKQTKSTIKDGVLIHGDDADDIRDNNRTPSPIPKVNNNNDDEEEEIFDDDNVQPPAIPPKRKEPSPKPENRDDVSVVDDDDAVLPNENDADEEPEPSFEIDQSVNDVDKANTDVSKQDDVLPPSAPPREKKSSRLPSPPPATTTANHEADDFFD